jgi:hypothetical protein
MIDFLTEGGNPLVRMYKCCRMLQACLIHIDYVFVDSAKLIMHACMQLELHPRRWFLVG